MAGLYIHIPFCKSKCHYCDFISFPGQERLINKYIKALESEIKFYSHLHQGFGEQATPTPRGYGVKKLPKRCLSPFPFFKTLYIGGGTPSVLSTEQIKKLLKIIEKNFGEIKNFQESTFEANPESLSEEKIDLLNYYGINRISLGLETSNDKLLKVLGRKSRYFDFLKAYTVLRAKSFSNISIDIISAIPSQTFEDFKKTLSDVLNLAPEHVSLYGLEIKKGTVFYEKKIRENPEMSYEMYKFAVKELVQNGFIHYEISNFARPGRESLHNLNYWNNGEYLGLGCGAVSYINGERRVNTDVLSDYINSLVNNKISLIKHTERLTGREKLGEEIILGLRKIKGIEMTDESIKEFKNEIESLKSKGFIELKNNKIKIKEN
jgi:oxygen-independent coproporphyrinogen-3 oxidase